MECEASGAKILSHFPQILKIQEGNSFVLYKSEGIGKHFNSDNFFQPNLAVGGFSLLRLRESGDVETFSFICVEAKRERESKD